ncbi:kinase-like protein [Auricularia subglabra TFB-10046 SS5]|nr:kinase-like protein [Auricularia subglabra TFB-10046 SS5]
MPYPESASLQLRELQTAQHVRHRYVLPALGIAKINLQRALVLPFMKNGNMQDYLLLNHELDCRPLILQLAEAIEHLHVNEGLVHGDIKCENVLISDNGDALLTDFGLSTFIARQDIKTETYIRHITTLEFAAPEVAACNVYAGSRRRSKSTQADVWAYGMTILQAFTRKKPWENVSHWTLPDKLMRGDIPTRPGQHETTPAISNAWWDTCIQCWAFKPELRPNIQTVRHRLAESLETFQNLEDLCEDA